MKIHITLTTIAVSILVTGCCSWHPKGPAYGHEEEFRKQIEASLPAQKWGYKIAEIRFSDNREKALVIFDTPAAKRQEVIFTDDGFHRYRGQVWDYTKMDASGAISPNDFQFVTIAFPSR